MLKNLSPRFIEELESPDPQPFAILEIQSKGQSDEATTEAHWTANISESNVDYDSTPLPPEAGNVILAAAAGVSSVKFLPDTDGEMTGVVNGVPGAPHSAPYYQYIDDPIGAHDGDTTYNFNSSGVDGNGQRFIYSSGYLSSIPEGATINKVRVAGYIEFTNVIYEARWLLKMGDTDRPGATMVFTIADWHFRFEDWATNPVTAAAWTREELADIQEFGIEVVGATFVRSTQIYLEIFYTDFETTGSITVELDLGASANTDNDAVISIDDNVPTDTGLSFTLEGSTSGAWGGEEVALGSVTDGSSVAGYRYYRPTANLTGDGSVTPVLKSIKIEIPDRIYRLTSRRGGIFNSLPYLIGIPGRSISIDLKDFVTLGSDLQASLQKDDYVVQMLRENYFKNLHASVRIGLYREDITEADLVYTFQGKVSGYRVGMEEVSISLKDATKDLSAKWPAGIDVTKDGVHMVDVINTVLDDVGIASRYINRGSLDTLKSTVGDGSPASINYVVYRDSSPPVASGDTTITEPETAKKVIGELLELLGSYMVSQEDGKIYVVEYDSSKASIGDPWTTSDDFVEDPIYNPDVENLINDTYVYFDWNGDGTDAKDFSNLETSPDATSITNWGETDTRIIKSKWLAGSAADGYYGEELAIHIGARETTRRKNGMGIFPCKTDLSKFELQVGDMKDVDMSDLIINPDVGEGDVRKFMIVNKDPDWGNSTISWSLVESR